MIKIKCPFVEVESYALGSLINALKQTVVFCCFLTSKLPLIVSLNVTDTVSDELPFSATVLMLNLMGEWSSRSSTKA